MKKTFTLLLSLLLVASPIYYANAVEGEENTESSEVETTKEEAKTTETETESKEENKETTEKEKSTDTETEEAPKEEIEEEVKEVDYTLKITGGKLDKDFDKTVFEYTVTVENEEEFDISVDTKGTNASYKIPNTSNLTNGKKINIIIDDKTYVLTVSMEEISLKLSSLKMTGYAFNEVFDKDVTSYTVTIPYEVNVITVDAKAEDEKATVTILESQLKDLKVGGNKVVVTVSDGSKKNTYTIYVTRSNEEKLEEKETSIITSEIIENNTSNPTSAETSMIKDEDSSKPDNPDSVLNYIIVSIGSFLLLVMGGIGIYFFVKTSPKKMKKEILKERDKKDVSPIVEIKNNENTIQEIEPIDEFENRESEETIEEDLEKTKEFKF